MKFLFILLFGCSTVQKMVPSMGPDKEGVKSKENIELKLAKLNSRMDEYEYKFSRQEQRIKLLEKASMLGLSISDLGYLEDEETNDQSSVEAIIKDTPKIVETKLPPKVEPPQNEAPASLPQKTISKGRKLEAQKFFESGSYGKAIAEYEKMADTGDGSKQYWISLSWLRLKEYETAHDGFKELIEGYPESNWVPRSKYYMAEIYYQLGYQKRAMTGLRNIIKEYPNEDAAQMARATIRNHEKNL